LNACPYRATSFPHVYPQIIEIYRGDNNSDAGGSSWGMFSYGDAPPAIGGGMGSFSWFNNRTALLNFVEEVLPFSPPGPGNSDPLAVAAEVRAVVAAARSGEIDLEKARKKLNPILKAYSQIEWMGTFRDLKDGNGAYARKVIKEYRRSSDLPVGASPIAIARSQLADFKIFLAEYGI
jgi:hypothetical protein